MINYWRSKRSCSKLRLRRAFDWLGRWHFQQPPQVREGYRSLVGVLVDRRWGEERDVCVLKKKLEFTKFRQCFFWKLTYKSFETSLSILSGLAALIIIIVARKTMRNRIFNQIYLFKSWKECGRDGQSSWRGEEAEWEVTKEFWNWRLLRRKEKVKSRSIFRILRSPKIVIREYTRCVAALRHPSAFQIIDEIAINSHLFLRRTAQISLRSWDCKSGTNVRLLERSDLSTFLDREVSCKPLCRRPVNIDEVSSFDPRTSVLNHDTLLPVDSRFTANLTT